MPPKVRFQHEFIAELGLHQITSPDLVGFYITAKTREEAEREALNMLALIRSRSKQRTGQLSSVTFEAA